MMSADIVSWLCIIELHMTLTSFSGLPWQKESRGQGHFLAVARKQEVPLSQIAKFWQVWSQASWGSPQALYARHEISREVSLLLPGQGRPGQICRTSHRGSAVMAFVFDFSEGDKDQKDLLGGKGANLAEMTNLGLPVPPGFIITTEACRAYMADGVGPADLKVQVTMALRKLEDEAGRGLGDFEDPLLVSVRSLSLIHI